jgi:hypothetical protein
MLDNREKRVGVTMAATMSDGKFVFEGMVENISRTGFKMTDIPAKFNTESEECTAVISSKSKNYKFSVRPTWSTEAGIYKVVGFEILSAPAEWIELLDELDPEGKVLILDLDEEPEKEDVKYESGIRFTLPGN